MAHARIVKLATILLTLAFASVDVDAQDAEVLASTYADATLKINRAQAEKPDAKDEEELAKRLPEPAHKALAKLVTLADSRDVREGLWLCGEAALELSRVDDFETVKKRLSVLAPDEASKLGIALARQRFLLRGLDGVEMEGLEGFANVMDEVLDAYDEVFGFSAFSKVPGKKLRVRVHLVPKIERPPHFAPKFLFHSEIDFPVIDAKTLRSPTEDGKFLFYGLCHELGHVIAMWGDASNEEDHHAWAHYTGVAIVEHLAAKDDPVLKELKDVRWRSLEIERKTVTEKKTKPSTADKDSVMALFIALHDEVGPKAIGAAINALDKKDERLRINQVRYYGFKEHETALLASSEAKKHEKSIKALFH